MYSNDEFLNNLNRPLMMAGDDDEDDDIFNEEAESDDDDARDSSPDGDEVISDEKSDSSITSSESGSSRNSTGITRNTLGFGALSFMGIIPLVLLILYMIKGAGLSITALLFMVAFFIGMTLSIWTFIYYRSGAANFTKFDVHSFFKWSEIAVISVVLLALSFVNLANLYSGGALRLSSESTLTTKKPEPIFAPKPPKNTTGFENEEVLYETKEFSPNSNQQKTNVKEQKISPQVKRVTTPVYRTQKVYNRTNVKPPKQAVAPVVVTKSETKSNVAVDRVEQIKAHEDEEGTSTTSGKKLDEVVDDAVSIAQISANNFSGAETMETSMPSVSMAVETSPLVSSLFLGGVMCAALGYAFPLAFAGAIIGLFRKFNHPFAAKIKEIINEETGEITLETEAQTTINKMLDLVFRFFIGFNIGGTIGFLLGIVITLPLYFIFFGKAETDPVIAGFLTSLGVVKNPDLAYATGSIVAGIMVPIVMLVVGKASPAGLTITEERVRQVYSIPVTINKVSTDMTTIPEPAIISFDLDEGEETKDGIIVDEFSDDPHESLTTELLSEFGVEMETVFGMKVDLPAKSNGDSGKMSNYEKQKVNSILENSLGELGNVTVQVSAELGKANIMLTDWLNLTEGMLIELDKPVSEEIDILINDVCKGKGKLTVIDNHLAVKVSKSHFSQSLN